MVKLSILVLLVVSQIIFDANKSRVRIIGLFKVNLEFSFSIPGLFQTWNSNKPGFEKLNSRSEPGFEKLNIRSEPGFEKLNSRSELKHLI